MRKNRRAAGAILAAAAAAMAVIGVSARAASLTFDADGNGPNTGGSGTWDTTSPLWTPDAGANYQAWSNATPDSAAFVGPSGTVSLGEAITVGTMAYGEFSDGTTIDLNSFNLTQTGGSSFFVDPGPTLPDTSVIPSSITITNTSPTRATYTVTTAPLASGPRLSGNMNVTFNSTGTWIPATVNDFTGTLLVTGGGQLRTDGGNAALGSASGLIQLDGTNTTLNYSTPSGIFGTYTRDIQMLNNTVRLQTNGVKMITLTGSISGGDLNLVANQGSLVLAGANTYTGATNITVASGSGASLVLAHNQALGGSTAINIGSGDQGGVGIMANPVTGNNVSLGTGVTMTFGSTVPSSGLGMLHNYNGSNTFSGNVALGSNHYRTFSTDAGSTLTLSGVVGSNGSARGLSKFGDGTLVLTGADTYGQANVSDGTNGTLVGQGVLRVDFSQSALNTNIINSGPGPTAGFSLTGNQSSQLVLSGGTLEVVGGGAGDTNLQAFSNRSTHGFTINPGESSVKAIQNGADSLSINVGRLMENATTTGGRHVGGTVDFTLPTTGNVILGTAATGSAGVANAILVSNGAAFATVGGIDWAGLDSTRNIKPGSALPAFYTANTDTTLAGNADMSGGVDTTLAANTSTLSLRFHNSGTRNIALGGFVLSTGGILVTADGNGPTSISGGTLVGNVAAVVPDRQDLVIIQRNTAAPLTIGAVIADNTTATALTKAGAGTLNLTAANAYTGPTVVTGGVLKLSNAAALGSGNLVLKGGVIGLTADSGDFTRALGTAAGQVRWYGTEGTANLGTAAGVSPISGGSGGFAAYGGTRIVNIGGAAATLRWTDTTTTNASFHFLRTLSSLILGASDADGTVDFQNPIQLQGGNTFSYQERNIQVENGSADVDAILSGVISSTEAGIIKSGPGTLALTAVNTYGGATNINAGVLSVGASSNLGSATNPLNFGGGTLKTTGAISTGRAVTLRSGGGTIDTAGNDVSLTGAISGVGGLTKAGAGILTLANAANNYAGPTSATGGTLLLPNSLTTSSAVSASDSGTIELASDGSSMKVIATPAVSVSGNGRIDLKDNKLITNSPAGTATAGVYNGLQGAVQSASNFGAWDGPGLTTTMPDAVAGLTTIAIATGEQVRGLGPTDTDTFAGQTITGASTIAMYTYAGDANLDGTIDGGDYGIIDNFAQVPGADGYANGDFNYDGVIDGGDYGLIDNNNQAQGAPFPTSGAASAQLSGVTAVPEPSTFGVALLTGAGLLSRRRRRRHV